MNRTFAAVVLGSLLFLGGATMLIVIGSKRAEHRAGEIEWPAELGKLKSVPRRYPAHETNAAALRLIELAKPLGITFDRNDDGLTQLTDYTREEVRRADAVIGEPPAEVSAFLAQHEAALDAVRDHLLASDVVWQFDPAAGFEMKPPHYGAHMRLTRMFVSRALVLAAADDAAAWRVLHAAWQLARSLVSRPEVFTQTIALAMMRQVSATAWKLPLPAPAWLEELHRVNLERNLAAAMQFEAWIMWAHRQSPFPVMRPLARLMVLNYVRHQRDSVAELMRVRDCAFDGKSFDERRLADVPRWNFAGNLWAGRIGALWARVFRFRAEREATTNIIRAAEGLPVSTASQCSDGTWRSAAVHDGYVMVAFSKEIAASMESDVAIPLTRERKSSRST